MDHNEIFRDFPKSRQTITASSAAAKAANGKNGYELRADMLALSWDILKHQSNLNQISSVSIEMIIAKARQLYDFVNENPARK